MGAATSKLDGPHSLGLGLVACLGAGLLMGYLEKGRKTSCGAAAVEAKATQMQAVLDEVRALQEKLQVASAAKARSDEECSQVQCQLKALQTQLKESEAATNTSEAAHRQLQVLLEESQQRARTLEKELHASREGADEIKMGATLSEVAQHALVEQVEALKAERDEFEESHHQLKALQVELEATRNVATMVNKKAQQELVAVRQRSSEAQRQVQALEEDKGHLENELIASRQKRKKSFSALEEINKKLTNVKSSWNPWTEISDIRGQLQQSLASEDDELLRGA